MSHYRYHYDPKREILWQAVAKHIEKDISKDASVLELGAGFCHFINNITAKRRFVVDISEEALEYASPGIIKINCTCCDLSSFASSSIDFIFISNLLEHLTLEEARKTLDESYRILTKGGKIGIVGPNFRYCAKRYFDDITHQLVLSHKGLSSLLEDAGFTILKLKKKFLPFSLVTFRLPVWRWAVRLYMMSPFKPFGAQMYLLAQKE